MTEEYPECEKTRKVQPQSQAIGEFLEWLGEEKKVRLCCMHQHTDACYEESDHKRLWPTCGWTEYAYTPIRLSIENLLAEFLEIDLVKVEKERRVMLEKLREVRDGNG